MNFCTKCGNQLKPDARFCGKCGETILQNVQPPQPQPAAPELCNSCGAILAPNVKFCTGCGKDANTATDFVSEPSVPVAAGPSPATSTYAKSPKKKKTIKLLAYATSTIILLALAVLAVYFFGTYNPDPNASLDALYVEEKYDKVQIDSAANIVETAFVNADTVKLAQILSPSSLEQKRPFFKELQPHMASFGNDFKTRKLLYATTRYAVYEFSSAEGTFTAEFCLGDGGKWNLMRF